MSKEINCSECQRDLSSAKITQTYDKRKDLEICVQCYQKEQIKYRGFNITNNNLIKPNGDADGSSELIVVFDFIKGNNNLDKCEDCETTDNVSYISATRTWGKGYFCLSCENKRHQQFQQNKEKCAKCQSENIILNLDNTDNKKYCDNCKAERERESKHHHHILPMTPIPIFLL